MEMFRNLIGQIGVFMICAQAVVHFRPKEAYGKYLRLLLGVMVLVQIFSPMYGLFLDREGEKLTGSIREFQQEMEESMGEAAERNAISNVQLEDMSLKMLQEIWEQTDSEEVGELLGMEDAEQEEIYGAADAGEGSTTGTDVQAVEIKIAPVKVGE